MSRIGRPGSQCRGRLLLSILSAAHFAPFCFCSCARPTPSPDPASYDQPSPKGHKTPNKSPKVKSSPPSGAQAMEEDASTPEKKVEQKVSTSPSLLVVSTPQNA